mmetsp:Transcript_113571/g.366944  ORF Transcript_113571/g.366944 Transcript_113571/m.366944 type:complete len:264 (-) Transcript_113571:752-1543(-)
MECNGADASTRTDAANAAAKAEAMKASPPQQHAQAPGAGLTGSQRTIKDYSGACSSSPSETTRSKPTGPSRGSSASSAAAANGLPEPARAKPEPVRETFLRGGFRISDTRLVCRTRRSWSLVRDTRRSPPAEANHGCSSACAAVARLLGSRSSSLRSRSSTSPEACVKASTAKALASSSWAASPPLPSCWTSVSWMGESPVRTVKRMTPTAQMSMAGRKGALALEPTTSGAMNMRVPLTLPSHSAQVLAAKPKSSSTSSEPGS